MPPARQSPLQQKRTFNNLGGKRQTTAMRGLCYSAQTTTAKGCPLNHLYYVLVLTKTGLITRVRLAPPY